METITKVVLTNTDFPCSHLTEVREKQCGENNARGIVTYNTSTTTGNKMPIRQMIWVKREMEEVGSYKGLLRCSCCNQTKTLSSEEKMIVGSSLYAMDDFDVVREYIELVAYVFDDVTYCSDEKLFINQEKIYKYKDGCMEELIRCELKFNR